MAVIEMTLQTKDYKAVIDYLKEFARHAPHITGIDTKYDTDRENYKNLQRVIAELEQIVPDNTTDHYTIRRALKP